MSKLTVMVLVIVIALGFHSLIEYALSNFVTFTSWTYKRELLLRLSYPALAAAVVYLIVWQKHRV